MIILSMQSTAHVLSVGVICTNQLLVYSSYYYYCASIIVIKCLYRSPIEFFYCNLQQCFIVLYSSFLIVVKLSINILLSI